MNRTFFFFRGSVKRKDLRQKMKFKSNRERPNLLSVPLEKKSEEGDRIIKVTVDGIY